MIQQNNVSSTVLVLVYENVARMWVGMYVATKQTIKRNDLIMF